MLTACVLGEGEGVEEGEEEGVPKDWPDECTHFGGRLLLQDRGPYPLRRAPSFRKPTINAF